MRQIVRPHIQSLRSSPWKGNSKYNNQNIALNTLGLTELTNKDGEFCPASCPTQAWSSATLLEFFHDLSEIQDKNEP